MKLSNLYHFLLITCLLPFSWAYASSEDIAPEGATGLQKNTSSHHYKSLVVTANPLASKAGLHILQQGGTAADAAVAIQAMLTLVEPQSSGIGGGAFLLYWDQASQKLSALDGRETAPLSADSTLFYSNSKPMKWVDALVGGRSVGTPGVLKMLDLAHHKYGKLPWRDLFTEAIHKAQHGFKVSPRLHKLIASGINPGLNRYPEATHYFYLEDGSPLPTGFVRTNAKLADSFNLIAQQGATAFYEGSLSESIIQRVQNAKGNPGLLSQLDLKQYKAIERTPVCLPYQAYQVCGFPPPTSGGVTVLQILKLLEHTHYADLPPNHPKAKHLFTQAARLAFADRNRYLADSDFIDIPLSGLLDKHYLKQRAQLINPLKDTGTHQPGIPQGAVTTWMDDQSPELPSTSHFVIVDQWGNAASMTSSIEMAFGSTLMVGGFLLNNQLTDFSFTPQKNSHLIANRVQPGKRPRSSMSPFMIFDAEGKLFAAIGSPGGSRIINYVAESLLMMLNTPLPLQQAINTPHVSNRNGITELEAGTSATQLAPALSEMGHQIKIRDLNSGLHAFRRKKNGTWESGVDNRREGLALGE